IYFISMFILWEDKEAVAIRYNLYEKYIGDMMSPFLGFFFPLLIIIITANITQIDHNNTGWQLMVTKPLSTFSIYLSILSVLLIGNLIAIVSFLGSFVVLMLFLSLLKDIPEIVNTNIPFGFLAQLTIRIFVASLFLSIVQFVISVVFRSFILPILIGFFTMLGTLILDGFQIYKVWNPFT